MSNIPTADSIDAAWFTRCLRNAGFHGVEVRSVRQRQIGTGQVGKCIRYELDLAGVTDGAPLSLVGKFPSDNDLSRDNAVNMGIYEREVMFYRDLAPRLTMRVPRTYFADSEAGGARFLLLMEDMAPAEQGDQLVGCSPAVVRSALHELVGMQAPTWCDEELAARLVEPEDGFFSDMHGLYNRMLPGFFDRFREQLTAAETRIFERLGASPGAAIFTPMAHPFCLEHRDYRPDNLLIDESQSPPLVVPVDFQGLRMGRPLNDVVLCLAGSLEPDVRRDVEEELLRGYHEDLLQAGVTGFDWDRCWTEYRRCAFAGFTLTVVSTSVVEQTERGDRMFLAMARRYAQHALDVDAEAFLD